MFLLIHHWRPNILRSLASPLAPEQGPKRGQTSEGTLTNKEIADIFGYKINETNLDCIPLLH